ncbi:hypothetical protein P692DRAFT_20951040 [Suillus brevipes Sb2]|nr:hypothetical protein P692DRAFT_20951040 [Suillus brevipes Sb2]
MSWNVMSDTTISEFLFASRPGPPPPVRKSRCKSTSFSAMVHVAPTAGRRQIGGS